MTSDPPVLDLAPARRGVYMSFAAPTRLGLATIAGFLLIFGWWSIAAPLSSAAIAQGALRSDGQRQAVQHPYGGVVSELKVRDGDRVSKGQVLMVLSETEPKARLDIVASERDALLAEESRLVAERERRARPDFASLSARRGEAGVAQAIANETAIMAARQREFDTQSDILRQKITQFSEQQKGLRAQVDGLERQKALLEEEAVGARQLLASGYTPKTRVLALERDAARLEAERGARLADAARLQEATGEAELEIARLEAGKTTRVTDRLREVQASLVGLAPRIAAAADAMRRTEIVAPASGSVVGLSVFTEGGVIQAGAKLMEIVPDDAPLIVDARLRIDDVSEVAVGDVADVRLTSLNRNDRPSISGAVSVVSADRLTDERSGLGYYAIQVRMEPQDVARARIPLQAGMAAEIVVTTKARSLLDYLAGPLIDEISGSFREK
jgi:HlyD family type I secretion membrane fusion protein